VKSLAQLEACLDDIRAAPRDGGAVELIVVRPAEDEREVLEVGWLDYEGGLDGDSWVTRIPRKRTTADPEAQLTLVNARAARAFAESKDRWPLAGDQLYVDMDLSVANLPPGTCLQIGEAIVVVNATPHTGCKKFAQRYGVDAVKFVMSPFGRELRLRGMYGRVLVSGVVRTGDIVRKVAREVGTSLPASDVAQL
jgi:hypothetical protein